MGPAMGGLGSIGENGWLAVLADASIKGVVVLAGAGAVCLVWRRAAAARRHLVWCMAVCGMLALPALSLGLPSWQVRMLPRWEGGAHVAAGGERESRSGDDAVTGPAVVEAERADLLARRGAHGDGVTHAEADAGAVSGKAGPQASDDRTFSGSAVILALWALGAVVVLAPHVIGLLSLRRLARGAEALDGQRWASPLESVSAELGLRRRVRLLGSGQTVMPMTWGVLRPTVLLPADADAWAEPWRRVVLLHELAHVKRWDFVTQALARLACAVYWFHPLVWLAARALRRYREQACDDCVLAAGTAASGYADGLLRLAGTLQSAALPSLVSVAMARRSHLEGRLLAILCPKRSRKGVTRRRAALAAIVTMCAVAPLAAIRPGAGAEGSVVELPTATAQQQDEATAPTGEEQADPLPPGVVRVFGSERFRIWWWPLALAVSPDGATIATSSLGHIQLTDLGSGRVRKVLETGSASVLAWSPDGRQLAIGSGKLLEVWDVSKGTSLFSIRAHSERLSGVGFADDGSTVITSGYDGMIKFWDATTGKHRREISAHDRDESRPSPVIMALSEGGDLFVSAGADGRVKLWNPASGGLVQSMDAHVPPAKLKSWPPVEALAISPNGSLVASEG